SLQRIWNHTRPSPPLSLTRPFSASADALVEIKPGEIGMVSGIPQEHLRRRVVIPSPARTATQQGSGKVGRWKNNPGICPSSRLGEIPVKITTDFKRRTMARPRPWSSGEVLLELGLPGDEDD
ncbi:hypothetical protein Tsubulata_037834, partial [Turnera subulata]